MNMLRTLVLIGFLTALAVSLGYMLGGRSGMIIAFIFSLITNIGSYWFSADIALRANNAQPVSREQAPELYQIVENITKRANLPMPQVYVIPTAAANAFATGRDPEHAAVAVTEGIMRILNWNELEGVLAHEIGHVRNRDILITSMASVMASAVTMIAHWGMYFGSAQGERDRGVNPIFAILLAVLAPVAAFFIQLAISRSREYEADSTGAELCGKPLELADALRKVDEAAQQRPMQVNPAYSSMYIIKPDPGNLMVNLCSTHPPTAERIRRLEKMAQEIGARS
ncbi:MAG: zinc metalloprotease HtpX [Terriglobales bacterium]